MVRGVGILQSSRGENDLQCIFYFDVDKFCGANLVDIGLQDDTFD